MLIVAAALDDSSERIIRYLQDEHEIDINAVFFSVYEVAGQEVLTRAWLADPIETQQRAAQGDKTPWSGMWYVNLGIDGDNRDWESCRKHGFISAGGGEQYSRPLHRLRVGDLVAAYRKGSGYVGVGRVTKAAVPADEFVLKSGGRLSTIGSALSGTSGDPDGEYVVGIDWQVAVPAENAKTFRGVFANQNIVCKLRHGPTLEYLRQQFGAFAAG